MSAETKSALEDAIRAHVSDECDGKVSISWVLSVYAVEANDFDNGVYYRCVVDDQPGHVTDGLLRCAERIGDDLWRASDTD